MANENPRNVQELTKGTTVSFKLRSTGDRFHGLVFYVSPESNGYFFGMQDVGVRRVDGRSESLLGLYHFCLNDVTELQVNVVPRQNPNPQDAENDNRDDGSSSKSVESKMESLRLDPPSK